MRRFPDARGFWVPVKLSSKGGTPRASPAWPRRLMMPGMTVLPDASRTRAAGGALTVRSSATRTMRPCSMRMAAFGRGALPVPSITSAFRMRVAVCADAVDGLGQPTGKASRSQTASEPLFSASRRALDGTGRGAAPRGPAECRAVLEAGTESRILQRPESSIPMRMRKA